MDFELKNCVSTSPFQSSRAIKSKPEVNTGSSQQEFQSQKISSKMSGSKKIKVEPFKDDFEHPLETSL